MEVHLSLSKLGENNLSVIIEAYSLLQGKPLEEDEIGNFLGITWSKGMESMFRDLSNAIRHLTDNAWDIEDIIPRTTFGETLDIPDC